MIEVVACSAVLVLIISVLLIWRNTKDARSPPGPFRYPLLGNIPQLGPVLHLSLTTLGQVYGHGMYQLHLMRKRIVVINKGDLARDVLIHKGSEVGDRTSAYVIDAMSRDGCSIVFGKYGPTWKIQRKIVHSALRMYGSGLSKLESLILREANELSEVLKHSQGKPIDPKLFITLSVMNVICALVFGKRYEVDDDEFGRIVANTEALAKLASPENPLIYLPWLRFFPLEIVKKLKRTVKVRDEFLQRKVDEHRDSFKEGEIRDFTDAMLKCIAEVKELDNSAKDLLTEDHLLMSVNDVFLAGFETTATALRWILLYVVSYPEVQARIHREIDDVIVAGREPELEDRKRLPYLEATICEVMRISPVFPIIRRKATTDMVIDGFDVPKGTFVYVNLWAIHHDPNEWESPNEFRPSRFLDTSVDLSKGHGMIPFGAGVRVCIGESLAKMELFLFISRLLCRFKFTLPEGDRPDMVGLTSTVYWPKPFKICAQERKV